MNKNPRTSRAPSRRRLMLESLEERIVLSLTYMTQPQTVITGQILAPIKVQGTAANIPVTISLNEQSISGTPLLGGTGTPLLGGTVTQNTDANKIATFSNLYVFGGTGQSALVTHDDFTLTASAASPTPGAPLDLATSTAFQVNPGGDHLYVSSTIPTTAAGASLGTITVQELDVNGNVVTTDSQTVVGLYFESNPGAAQFLDAKTGAALGTTIMATMSQGVATFVNPATGNNLAMDKAAIGYTLGVQATTANNGSTILPTTSNAFVITAGAPTGLGFLTQPTLTDSNVVGMSGQTWTINEYNPNLAFANTWNGVIVGLVDKFGNQVTSGISGGSVTITAISAAGKTIPFDSSMGHTATSTVPIDPITGVAVFSNLLWTRIGNQTASYTAGNPTIKVLDAQGIQNLLNLGGPGSVGLDGPGMPDGTSVISANVQNGTVTVSPAPHKMVRRVPPSLSTAPVSSRSRPRPRTPQSSSRRPPPRLSPLSPLHAPRCNSCPASRPPATAQVRSALPVIKVAVVDQFGQVITQDNSDVIVLKTGGITGTLYETVVNGVATFSDLAVGGQSLTTGGAASPPLVLNFQYLNQALGVALVNGAPAMLKLTPGPADHLLVVNRTVGTIVGGVQTITAGSYIKDSNNNPIVVEVVDQDNNVITTDNSTVVSIGLLPNEGRGPVYVGYGPAAGAINYAKPVTNNPNDSFDFQSIQTAKAGIITFTNLYMDFVGAGYILSAGTTSFVNHAGADTAPFNVVAAAASNLVIANQGVTDE